MKKYLMPCGWALATVLLIVGLLGNYGPEIESLRGLFVEAGTGEVVIVMESADAQALPASQVGMLNALAIKRLVRRVDPQATGPDVPKWAIDASADKKLPAWVSRRGTGRPTVSPLPADEPSALVLLRKNGVLK